MSLESSEDVLGEDLTGCEKLGLAPRVSAGPLGFCRLFTCLNSFLALSIVRSKVRHGGHLF